MLMHVVSNFFEELQLAGLHVMEFVINDGVGWNA